MTASIMGRSATPIAIVGAAALFPGSADKTGFWRDILAGTDLITDVPPSHWRIDDYYDPDPRARDKTYAKRGAFLPEVDFDPIAWGIPPSNVPATDTAQLLALIVAQQVLEDAAGAQRADLPRDRISVILGCTSAQQLLGAMVSRLQRPVWSKALREQGLSEQAIAEACERIASHYVEWQESTFPGVLGNVVAGRIANRLNLGGTNCVTDAACASSLSALAMAVAELRLGDSDLVITGGADTMNDIFMYVCFSKTPALSPTGDCRPFSDRADGTLLGEGIGMVALKRLDDAERDGDRIYAVIRGIGSSSDGRAKSVYAPVPEGQAAALRRAYAQAGYGPETVTLVEAHGTGTKAGDVAEIEGLRQVFDASGRADRGWCALGSVKSQIGHTKAAAGAAGLFKAVMALAHKTLPPTIKVERPDPKLALDHSPFYLNTVARPWIAEPSQPRRASVSSFGFGGSNFHVTLEEYVGKGRPSLRIRPRGVEAVLISGGSYAELAARCRELAGSPPAGMLDYLARATQESFSADAAVRLAVLAASDDELGARLGMAAERCARGDDVVMPGALALRGGPPAGDVAFVFPGQGSQYVAMASDVAMTYDAARAVWDRARGIAPLDERVYPRPVFDDAARGAQAAALTATEWAQPAIGATSLALLAVLDELGIRPAAVAGHSFGELTALCAAGAMSRDDLLRAARRRGELMAAAAATPGAMISVTGAIADVRAQLASAGLPVVIANHNAPHQVVLSGATDDIAAIERRLASAGLGCTRLAVATAFHSRIVEPARAPFREALAAIAISAPAIDVYGNASAALYPREPDAIRDALASQLVEPVRFVEQIEAMYARGIRIFVEVGPSAVLTGLIDQILRGRPHTAIALDRKGKSGLASLHEGLALLSVAGVPLDYARLWAPFAGFDDPRARKRPAMTLALSGTSYGKLYPPATPPTPSRIDPVPVAAPVIEPVRSVMPIPDLPVAPPAVAAAPDEPVHAVEAIQSAPIRFDDRDLQLAWITAFQESQRQTAEAHAAFLRVTAESHAHFLRGAETSLQGLAAIVTGAPPLYAPPPASLAPPPAPYAPPPASFASAPVSLAPRPAPYAMPMPAAPPAVIAPLPQARAPSATKAPQVAKPPAPSPASPPHTAAAPSLAELQALALRVVAACTGYPEEMLGLDMDLEADLGVDSIKRVEILSALTEQAPGLPEVAGAELAAKRTLRQILAHYQAKMSGDPPDPPRGGGGGGRTPDASSDAPGLAQGTSSYPAADDGAPLARLPRYAVHAVSAPAHGPGIPGLFDARSIAIVPLADAPQTADGRDCAALAAALCARFGAPARAVADAPRDADAVILLGMPSSGRGPPAALAIQRAAFAAARSVAARFATRGGAFVTIQDTGGDFGLAGTDNAWLAGLAGLAKTAALEWPLARVHALDVARGARSIEQLADAIWRELQGGCDHREIGIAGDGRRITLALRGAVLPAAPGSVVLAPGGVVIASGGARGVTAACMIALAGATRGRFVLLGRTALVDEPAAYSSITDAAALRRALYTDAQRAGQPLTPAVLGRRAADIFAAREVRATLAAIRSAGGEARYDAVDITDAAAVARVVAAARSWGPIAGVIHAAGVLADKRIAEKTDAQLERVLATKVLGLAALLDATRDDDLTFLAMFSSVAARLGNPGQADYAMANEILNKVAAYEQRRRGPRCIVRAIGWGPWDGGMVDDGLRAQFAARGVPLISLAAGAHQLCAELAAPGDVEVIVGHGLASGADRVRDHGLDHGLDPGLVGLATRANAAPDEPAHPAHERAG